MEDMPDHIQDTHNPDTQINSIQSPIQELDVHKKHKLNCKWIVWYHNPSDKSWTQDSYKDILEIETLEELDDVQSVYTNVNLTNI